jgi:hypothetical protein
MVQKLNLNFKRKKDMKNILLFVGLVLMLSGCVRDDMFIDTIEPPKLIEALEIVQSKGLKLESIIVSNEVLINVKLEVVGSYKIKIRNIVNKIVSQEIIQAKAGDNILKVYTSTLPKSAYTIQLTNMDNQLIGSQRFTIKN